MSRFFPQSIIRVQGTAHGRSGRVHAEHAGDDIWIGGNVVTCIEGKLQL